MAFNRPNTIFIVFNGIEPKLNDLECFYVSLKEKHSTIFLTDLEDNFIEFTWFDTSSNPIGFNVTYSTEVPIEIQDELNNFLGQWATP